MSRPPVGGYGGPLVIVALLLGCSGFLCLRSRLQPVSADNVNDDWDDLPAASRRRKEMAS